MEQHSLRQSKLQGELQNLLRASSKHSDYQSIHPSILSLIGRMPDQRGRWESERSEFMFEQLCPRGLEVLDIGANTGYFTFACVQAGARLVVSHEGNATHARFIELAAEATGASERIHVRPTYYDFKPSLRNRVQLALCLNVLHHLGADFGSRGLSLHEAKEQMAAALNSMSTHVEFCWLQLGFNWKGRTDQPLFRHGLKSEVVEFVRSGVKGHWTIEAVAVFDPQTGRYESANEKNMERFDSLGEFRNRPLFLLRSLAA